MKNVVSSKYSVVIVGAGLLGSALARALTLRGVQGVAVLDLDLQGEWSSSERNAGGVRATWSKPVNIELSKRSIDFFSKHAERVGYRSVGYLWLHNQKTFDAALKARELHLKHQWPVEVWSVDHLRSQVPFIDKTSDLVGALFGVRDGLINPNGLKEFLREEAIKGGAVFLDRHWVKHSVAGVGMTTLQGQILPSDLSSEGVRSVLEGMQIPDEKEFSIDAEMIVNCAGGWAPGLAKILGHFCASFPVRRQISLFQSRDVDLTPYGMMIDTSGVYFHPEATFGLAGYANPNEQKGIRFDYDESSFFEEYIWAPLYERATGFEGLKHVSGWAGLYENSPDHVAVIGEAVDERGQVLAGAKVFEAHSFSGHGAMQCIAVADELSHLMVKSRYEDLDLSPFSARRFLSSGILQSDQEETWII